MTMTKTLNSVFAIVCAIAVGLALVRGDLAKPTTHTKYDLGVTRKSLSRSVPVGPGLFSFNVMGHNATDWKCGRT